MLHNPARFGTSAPAPVTVTPVKTLIVPPLAKASIPVTPAKAPRRKYPWGAGVQYGRPRRPMRQGWIPAFAGMTAGAMNASAAFAGMTAGAMNASAAFAGMTVLDAAGATNTSAVFAGATTFKASAAISAGTDFNRNIAP